MKISLRPGEKIYVNGAVFSVDRRVSLELLNDVTFLLESHVMQAIDATTPLRQLYFAIQTMLMDPKAENEIRESVLRMLHLRYRGEARIASRDELDTVVQALEQGRAFDALRIVRGLYRLEEAGERSH